MSVWIAFFRGINVGGHNLLPMKALAALMEKSGCEKVQTYIQSGNVVFHSTKRADELEKCISAAVVKAHGFQPRVFLIGTKELKRAIKSNPFPHATENYKSLHLYFLSERPKRPDLKGLNALKAADESFVLTKEVFYLHAPAGIGKSKLAGRAEILLGVAATARNWQTVTKIIAMAEGLS